MEEGELGRDGFPDQDCAGPQQMLDAARVPGRAEAAVDRRSPSRRKILRVDDVLGGERHSCQRPSCPSRSIRRADASANSSSWHSNAPISSSRSLIRSKHADTMASAFRLPARTPRAISAAVNSFKPGTSAPLPMPQAPLRTAPRTSPEFRLRFARALRTSRSFRATRTARRPPLRRGVRKRPVSDRRP